MGIWKVPNEDKFWSFEFLTFLDEVFRIFLNVWEHYNELCEGKLGGLFLRWFRYSCHPASPWTRTTSAFFNFSHSIIQEQGPIKKGRPVLLCCWENLKAAKPPICLKNVTRSIFWAAWITIRIYRQRVNQGNSLQFVIAFPAQPIHSLPQSSLSTAFLNPYLRT